MERLEQKIERGGGGDMMFMMVIIKLWRQKFETHIKNNQVFMLSQYNNVDKNTTCGDFRFHLLIAPNSYQHRRHSLDVFDIGKADNVGS